MITREYRIEEINFSEESKKQIAIYIDKYQKLLDPYAINLLIEIKEIQVKSLPLKMLKSLIVFKKEVNVLLMEYPKLRYAYEFNNIKFVIEKSEELLEKVKGSFPRIDQEMSKIYNKEVKVSENVTPNELKAIYAQILEETPVKQIEILNYSKFFLEATIRVLLSKSGFQFSQNDEVQLRGFRNINENLFNWISQQMFADFIVTKFNLVVPNEKNEIKQFVTRSDDLGKRTKLNPMDVILFEGSLGPIDSTIYMQGVKFRYPENSQTEYQAVSKYVVSSYSIKFTLEPEKMNITLPVFIGMLKAEIPKTVKNVS
jgi:hypothetical protein